MIPVKSEDLDTLARRNTVLIFDFTCWTTSYLRNVIGRSTKHITTKQGNKTLPAELWLHILSLVEFDVNKHDYRLVYPVEMSSVQLDGRNPKPALVCNEIQEWSRCGHISTGMEFDRYRDYIENPSYEFEQEEDEEEPPESPFKISKQVLPDHSFVIPVSDLGFKDPFLYGQVETPDVIAWLENGDCKLCGGGYTFCPGCRDGRQVLEEFTDRYRASCGIYMLCPLCVGVDYAERSLDEQELFWNGPEQMTDDEYDEWVDKRRRDLGYR